MLHEGVAGAPVKKLCRHQGDVALHRGPAPVPVDPAERWSMDFVHDQLADGRAFRVLTVVDQWSRQSPMLEAGFSLRGTEVAAALDRVLATGVKPQSITLDHVLLSLSRLR